MNQYIDIPLYTTFNDIANKGYTLSATQYKSFNIKNKNIKLLSELIDRDLTRKDLGCEVGSECYVESSPYMFIKTKALQEESYLIDITKDSVQNIIPRSYVEMKLKKGDVLISKDSNVGEIVILDKDYPNTMLCGGIYKLPLSKHKYYILAYIKSNLFRQQIDFLVPRGSTIRHGKTKFLDCYIPFPNKSPDKTIEYVELLMKSIINKEICIQKRYEQIQSLIKEELNNNQSSNTYHYTLPSIDKIMSLDRMDSSLYSEKFTKKEFLLKNYKHGFSTISELGFEFVRGNNLAVSVIGKSIYSSSKHDGFYTLILPKNMSKYGTMNKIEYLGNKSKMIKIKQGAIIFGAEGNEKGRSWVAIDSQEDTITNFHGLTLYQKNSNLSKSIFVKLFLDYFRATGMVDDYATGGNGGSLSIKYWDIIPFPNFPEPKEKELVKLYYNPDCSYNAKTQTLNTFADYDNTFNSKAGIYELDKSMKRLKNLLQIALDRIANDEDINIVF